MSDADPRSSDTPIPGESPEDYLVVPATGGSRFGYDLPFSGYFHPPRLGIFHLLAFVVLTTGLILFFALLDKLNSMPDHSWIMILWKGLQFLRNMVTAASWVGLGMLLAGKIRGIPGRLQPGQWILMFESMAAILSFLFWGIVYLGLESNSHGGSLFVIFMGYESFFLMLAYALLIFFLQEAISWKVLFGALAVLQAASGLMFFDQGMRLWMHYSFTRIRLPLEIAVLLVLIVTLALDRKNYSFRDWLHWLGLFLIGYGFSLSIIWEGIQYLKFGILKG